MSNNLKADYKEHQVFRKLTSYISFYEELGMSVIKFPACGTKLLINSDCTVYSSIGATLESIRIILEAGQINDAFALLRKYHDATIINIYLNLYIADHSNNDVLLVDKINNWVYGKEKLPYYNKMQEYIEKSDKLKVMAALLSMDKRYEAIRDECNNHTHYNNFFHNVSINDKQNYGHNRIQLLDKFLCFLQDLFSQHIAYIFYLHDHYMASNDHIDYLECGIIPPTDSQYWVATFIQDILDSEIKLCRMDIYNEIKNRTCMQLN